MRKIIIALGLCCFLVFAGSASSQTAAEYISQGDSLYALFDYVGSAELYEQACVLDSANNDPFWKLARSVNLMGETAPKDSQEAIFEKGRGAAEHAISLDENNAESHFQLARS